MDRGIAGQRKNWTEKNLDKEELDRKKIWTEQKLYREKAGQR